MRLPSRKGKLRNSWYWLHFKNRPLSVTVHLNERDMTFGWTRIHGLQLGSWFIGVIRGEKDE
jgi:hypothetical protein